MSTTSAGFSLDDVRDVVFHTDAAGRWTYLNRAWTELTGFDRKESLGRIFLEFVHPEDRQRNLELFEPLVQRKKDHCLHEIRYLTQDGGFRWVEVHARLTLEADGTASGTTGTLRDATARRQAEAALRESEERFRTLADGSPVILWVTDARGANQFINRTYREYFQLEPGGAEGAAWRAVLHPEDAPGYVGAMEVAIRERSPFRAETRVEVNGEWRWLASTAEPRFSTSGEFLGHVGISLDVTERKRSEGDLRRLEAAVTQAPVSIVITDSAGVVQYVNPAFEQLTGYAAAEVAGRTMAVLKSGRHDAGFYRQLWGTISTGAVWSGRLVNRSKQGRLFTEDAVIAPVKDGSGRIRNYVAVKRDVTRELDLHAQLLQSQKLESIGRLAGGVAHDFNNLLTVVVSCAEELQRRLGAGDPATRADVEDVLAAAGRASELTRQLLAFARKQLVSPVLLDLNATVRSTEKLLRRVLGEDIELVVELEPEPWGVLCDPGQIDQVLMNLAVNARDAMPGGGRLVVRTRNVELSGPAASPGATGAALPGRGQFVELTLGDTGEGLSDEAREHLFEPFFTTKAHGQGTGLGLATVFGIVTQIGGHIAVDSEPRQGTTFRIYLPRARAPASADPSRAPATGRGGSETVLVVEDDDMVRSVTTRALRAAGYTVIEASSPAGALTLAAAEGARLDLLVTDVIMPGRSGPQVAQEIRQTRPRLPVLYVSGYPRDALSGGALQERGTEFLAKPFTPAALRERVRALLDAA